MSSTDALEAARTAASKARAAKARADAARAARDAAIVEAYRAGARPLTIGKALDMSRSAVRKVLDAAGVLDASETDEEA